MLKDKNILYIVHDYNFFQKDPIEEVSKYFNKVYVLVRYRPLSWFAKYLPIKSLRKYEDSYVIDLTNLPKNVEVIRTPVWYLPIGIFYKWLGELHFKAVDKAIKKYNIKFDLVHCHFISSSGYVGMRLKEKYNKPFVVTGHGFDVYDQPFKSGYWKEKTMRVLKTADKVLTVGRKNREILNKELSVVNVEVLPNGYAKELFYFQDEKECRKKLGLSLDKKIMLTIGNLVEVKGYEYLIKALDILRKNDTDFLCLHIGAGALEESIKKMVRERGLEEEISFLGRMPHHKLVDYFGASDFFVSSSLSEGNPTVMFESLGCGKPFVGTKVGGVPEIITSDKYGLLCEPGDERSLAENIQKALEKEWDTDEILKYGEQFSWENICKNIIEKYKEVIQ